MNTKIKNTLKTLSAITLAVLVSVSITQAIGTLTPGDTPGEDTQYTLNDIHEKLTDFTTSTSTGSGTMTVPETISATFATLSEIYALLEAEDTDLVPENIADGVEIFGVEGELSTTTPELTWSSVQGPSYHDVALLACAGTVDGSTGWRLPEIYELTNKFYSDIIVNNISTPYPSGDYWSNRHYDPLDPDLYLNFYVWVNKNAKSYGVEVSAYSNIRFMCVK